jgi:diketogulonate reductase-like aldo/keto reductase
MPLLGFGTWQLTGRSALRAVAEALAAGYRHVDTATMYRNEREVGGALAESGVSREEVFITTKLPPNRFGRARQTLDESLRMLGVDRLDLWLLHWPAGPDDGLSAYRELVQARRDGLARDIGVSNYSLEQLDRFAEATGVLPAVNQIEWSPLLFDAAILSGHRERGVVLEGYSGLKGGVLEHPAVREVAERLQRSPAQVVIRWHLEHQIVVIPKSARAERIRSNADVGAFRLSQQDVAAMDALGGGRRR